MRIQNNTAAFNVWSSYSQNSSALKKSMSKLSTGVITNTDDAAGLGISERMRAEVKGVTMARNNVNNAVSLVQTADGWLQKINDMTARMKALKIEHEGIVSTTDQENIHKEFDALVDEIQRITGSTQTDGLAAAQFNGYNLLGGDSASVQTINVQIGATSGQTLSIDLGGLASVVEGSISGAKMQVSTVDLVMLDSAINVVAGTRASLGAQQVRLEHTAAGLTSYEDNLRSAESKIRDVDMARESSIFAKNQILTNAANAMLAQANQLPNSVMQLLG